MRAGFPTSPAESEHSMGYRVLEQFTHCTVCGVFLVLPQTALIAERNANPEDIRDAIENNEVCEPCWEWARNDDDTHLDYLAPAH